MPVAWKKKRSYKFYSKVKYPEAFVNNYSLVGPQKQSLVVAVEVVGFQRTHRQQAEAQHEVEMAAVEPKAALGGITRKYRGFNR